MNEREVEVRAIAAERLTFFADAVIAIAITLLALDLPLPAGDSNAEVLRSAGDDWPAYLAFLLSFTVIGRHWSAHHRVFRYVTSLGGRLGALTMVWLLLQVVTPFATRVITGDGAYQARFGFYSLVQGAAGITFVLMIREVRGHTLHRSDMPPEVLAGAAAAMATLAAAFLVSIPVSFLTEQSWLCWILVPVAVGAVRRRRGRP
ncbi:TMEM175 family protein [Phytohabitans sp. ZYX-F-186]|uniref:TMEM175 family protein n=1 Tax=Phytohabitans maris TaxID=3071409 RepID=A0ABU0ZGZ4_9ACTN|nr:TMEM175 family protein [Phytohabitans sp. ZYX-F-186]MDQ7906331.1 TMEM175 family protein [Phytohabitans sp. ZYX-F-186]